MKMQRLLRVVLKRGAVFRVRFKREKLRNIFANQLGKGFVQIRTYGDVAFVASVVVGELLDHARLFVKAVTFELHRAWLQSAIACNNKPAKTSLAVGGPALLKILARRIQSGFVIGDPIRFVHTRFEFFKAPFQDGQLLLGVNEIVPASRASRRIGTVVDIDTPFGSLIGNRIDLFYVPCRDAVV